MLKHVVRVVFQNNVLPYYKLVYTLTHERHHENAFLCLLGYNKLELLIFLNAVERESLQNLRFSHDFVSFTWWYAGVTK